MRTLILLTSHTHKDDALQQLSNLRNAYSNNSDVACLFMDDAREHKTFEAVSLFLKENPWPACLLLQNQYPLGPGGIQKVAIRHAIETGMDAIVVILGGNPGHLSAVPRLLEKFQQDDRSDYLLTSERFSRQHPLEWSRWLCQRALSLIESKLSGARIPDWHGPLRIYRVSALREIAFELNTHEAHFHTEVLLQLISAQRRRTVTIYLPLDTTHQDSSSYIGFWKAIKAALKFRLQRYNLFYDFRYHPELVIPGLKTHVSHASHYTHKPESNSPHSLVCKNDEVVPPHSRVLDIGCSSGYVADYLTEKKGCSVVGIDMLDPSQVSKGLDYHQLNLEHDGDRLSQIIDKGQFDVILILDVLEHLSTPELFLLRLYSHRYQKVPRIVVSTGNVGFIIVRLMLLSGYFNYGNKGILDITHKRLFTLRTFKNLLDQTGFAILRRYAFPLPWKELGISPRISHLLEKIHGWMIRLRPTLFAYQVMYVTTPLVLPYKRKG